MDTYSPDSLTFMRQTIQDSFGNEVFFVGHTDAALNITRVEVVARGHCRAVPALIQQCRAGDVVIHNHPSGHLTPSDADLQIAGLLGEAGIGFHIVNNSVNTVYKVVEAQRSASRRPLEPHAIAALLAPDGALAQQFRDYEDRPQQLRMALTVASAFNEDKLALIEAGTGTGKSLAYLIPAVLWALHNEETVVISTNTINLQEQLVSKDLPLLSKCLGEPFRAVLVKGRNNYLCHRRLQQAQHEPDLFQSSMAEQLADLRSWAEQSRHGSRDELIQAPSAEIWNEICCEVDQCPRIRCPHYSQCFFHKARRFASQADLLVVNHALLLSDLAVRAQTANYTAAAVLPPYRRIILDEAHHLEDAATRYFSIRVSHFSFTRILNRLLHPRKAERGILPRWLAQTAHALPDTWKESYEKAYQLTERLSTGCRQLRQQAHDCFSTLRELFDDVPHAKGNQELNQRITEEFAGTLTWNEVVNRLTPFIEQARQAALQAEDLIKLSETFPDATREQMTGSTTDLQAMAQRLLLLAGDLATFLRRDPNHCNWTEISRASGRSKEPVLWLNSAPIELAELLNKTLYDRYHTVILTSATLTVDHQFSFFRQRTGLGHCPANRVLELQLDSPFDFSRQALIAIPDDLADPTDPGFAEQAMPCIEQSLLAARGNAFVLFTAYTLLQRVFNALEPSLFAQGLSCLRQGQRPRHQLLKDFTRGEHQVLFGTDSFWEGVDVQGDDLQLVIITRLPFRVPTEPIQLARCEAIEQQGGNPFSQFTVPQAVIRLKQGFGRLIRHRKDRGVVLILDRRVISKPYGRRFLNSLPATHCEVAPARTLARHLQSFFSTDPDTGEQEKSDHE
ncbi:MAG: DEAD/DEAH box helicase [Desulfuromonadaceae bacterium]|nr:DEAD/DEAH box helicase [Desulfuromonadaceae bacterium]